MGTGFYGPTSTNALIFAIDECLDDWGDDPAYAQTAQKLREVCRELDVLMESPGHRAAARAASDNQSGQRGTKESAKDY